MTERPPRTSRPESREVIELKQLKLTQPELGTAIDMQVALVEMQRRVQARVPLLAGNDVIEQLDAELFILKRA